MFVYDLEACNTDRDVPYGFGLYEICKVSGKYYRDKTDREYEKCRNDCIVFKGTDCNNNMLDHNLEFKGEANRIMNKIEKYRLYFFAHKGSHFDGYVVSNFSPQWRTVVSLIKSGSGIVSLKIFNGYVDRATKLPQYVFLK